MQEKHDIKQKHEKCNLKMNDPGGASVVSLKNCFRDKSQLLEQYKRVVCHYCQKFFNDPVQLKCFHSICRKCVDKLMDEAIKNRKVAQCPYEKCGVELTGEQSFSASLDQERETKQFLLSTLKCQTSEDCPWEGIFEDYKRHIEEKHTFIVREVLNENSTYQLYKCDGTVSSKNVQIVGSLTSVDSGISCSSTKSINPSGPSEVCASSDNLKNEVQCESIEDKNWLQEPTELVVEKVSSTQQLEPLNCNDSLLFKESVTSSQHYSPPNVLKQSPPLLNRATSSTKTSKSLTRRSSLSPSKQRKQKRSHSRNPSLPNLPAKTQITASNTQNISIVEDVPDKTGSIQKQIMHRRASVSLPVSLPVSSFSSTPSEISSRWQKRPGSAMPTTYPTNGIFSPPQRHTLPPIENNASFSHTPISTSRCTSVDCQQILAKKDQIIARKDEIIRVKDHEIHRLKLRAGLMQ